MTIIPTKNQNNSAVDESRTPIKEINDPPLTGGTKTGTNIPLGGGGLSSASAGLEIDETSYTNPIDLGTAYYASAGIKSYNDAIEPVDKTPSSYPIPLGQDYWQKVEEAKEKGVPIPGVKLNEFDNVNTTPLIPNSSNPVTTNVYGQGSSESGINSQYLMYGFIAIGMIILLKGK